jgi:hypothetical protein
LANSFGCAITTICCRYSLALLTICRFFWSNCARPSRRFVFVWLCHCASLVRRCHSFGQCTSPLLRTIAIFCIILLFQAQACAALAPSHPSITPTGDRNLPSRRRASSHQDSSRQRAIINHRADGQSSIFTAPTGVHCDHADGRHLLQDLCLSRLLVLGPFQHRAVPSHSPYARRPFDA